LLKLILLPHATCRMFVSSDLSVCDTCLCRILFSGLAKIQMSLGAKPAGAQAWLAPQIGAYKKLENLERRVWRRLGIVLRSSEPWRGRISALGYYPKASRSPFNLPLANEPTGTTLPRRSKIEFDASAALCVL
jgi:hypothetical protein